MSVEVDAIARVAAAAIELSILLMNRKQVLDQIAEREAAGDNAEQIAAYLENLGDQERNRALAELARAKAEGR